MKTTHIHGRSLQSEIAASGLTLTAKHNIRPRITLISVAGDDPMLEINRRLHLRTLDSYGIDVDDVALPNDTDLNTLITAVREANANHNIHAIMTLLPLPPHLSIVSILPEIDPGKEVEGLHPDHSRALIASNHPPSDAVVPLVPDAVLATFSAYSVSLENSRVVILTSKALMESNPVANTVARMAAPAVLPLSCPVTVVPIEHPSAQQQARDADVLIVSLEETEIVTADWVKQGATVVDFNPNFVGLRTNNEGREVPVLRGGVDTDSVDGHAGVLGAVPGGVGPVMLGILVRNIALTALRQETCHTNTTNDATSLPAAESRSSLREPANEFPPIANTELAVGGGQA